MDTGSGFEKEEVFLTEVELKKQSGVRKGGGAIW